MTNYIGGEEDTCENEENNQHEEGGNEVMDQELAELKLGVEILRVQRQLRRMQLEKLGNSSSESRQEVEEKSEVDASSVIVYESEDDYEEATYKTRSKAGNKLKV